MPPSPLALRRAAAAGVLALLLAALVVAVLSPARHQQRRRPSSPLAPPPGARRPLLVIDAGSSGTRVHAFRLELAGVRDGGGAAALGRRGGPGATRKANHHPFAVRSVDVVPSSAAPGALPTAGDGKRGMYDRVETRPGLDQVVAGPQGRADPEAVLRSRALGPLLDWASAALRATAQENEGGGGAPVFFGGTGGLRRMPPRERERLLEAARHVLRSDARLAFEGGGNAAPTTPTTAATAAAAAAAAAGVLPGAREAAFGWVATNWARGLIKPPLEEKQDKSAQLPKTMGVLDLGGASLEVAFEVEEEGEGKAAAAGNTGGAAETEAEEAAAAAEDPFARPPSAVVELRVGGAGPLRRVHTHAFHGYGLNEAFDRAVTRLLEEQEREEEERRREEERQREEEERRREDEASVAAAAELAPTRRSGGVDGNDEQRQEEQEPPLEAATTTTTTSVPRAPAPPPLAVVATPRRRRRLSSDGAGDVLDTAAAEAHAADAAVAAMQAPRPSGRVAVGNEGAGAGGTSALHLVASAAPPPTPVVRHPCLHAGYEAPYERIAHRHSHHADPEQQQVASEAGGGGGAAAGAASSTAAAAGPPVVTLVGAPDWPACRRLMAAVVDADAPCARHPRPEAGEECRLGALQPALKGRRFAALSGFDAVWRFLGADPSGGTAALLQAAERWCSVSWPFDQGLAAQIKPDAAHSVNGERYCAWAPYAASLLSEGLGLSDGEFDIGGGAGGGGGAVDAAHARLGAVGWPLGAALVEGPRLLEEAATAAAATVGGGGEERGLARSPARRPLLPMLLLAVLAAGVLGLVIAAFGASSTSLPPPPRGGWVGLGPAAGRGGGGGGGSGKGGGSGNGHGLLLPPALLPLHAAPSMLSLRSSSFAQGLAAGASVASSPGSPRAFATSSSFSFGSSSMAPLQPLQVVVGGGGGGAVPRRETSPTLWRSPSPVGIGGGGGGGGVGLLPGSTGSLRGL